MVSLYDLPWLECRLLSVRSVGITKLHMYVMRCCDDILLGVAFLLPFRRCIVITVVFDPVLSWPETNLDDA
jgi:hypothetical protein